LGRFQPLHLGHLEYLEAARARCDRVVIGITSPDPSRLVSDDADRQRSLPESNPFSYFDRLEMISASLLEQGWPMDDFLLVPADVNRPESLAAYLPPPTVSKVFLTVYDDWAARKSDLMSAL